MSEALQTVYRVGSRLAFFATSLLVVGFATRVQAQTIPIKAIFYEPTKSSLWGELADDCGYNPSTSSCTSPTPRQAAVLRINQHFYGISANTHANAVVVYIPDEDSFQGQYGGGFTYDPVNRPRSSFGVAQEILVSIATAHNLKVIFEILPSPYHVSVDDTAGNSSGAYDFYHAIMTPAAYYGSLSTTRLSSIGLTDHTIHDFVNNAGNDSRIAAWYFGGEWLLSDTAQAAYFAKYYPWFQTLVRYFAPNTQLVAVYPLASIDWTSGAACHGSGRLNAPIGSIHSMKDYFATLSAGDRPDLYAIEWYGGSGASYDLTCASTDITILLDEFKNYGSYTIAASKLGIHEGGTDYAVSPISGQPYNSYASQFFADAASTVANYGAAEMAVWASESNYNAGSCSTSDASGLQRNYALYQEAILLSTGATPSGITSGFCPTLANYTWHYFDSVTNSWIAEVPGNPSTPLAALATQYYWLDPSNNVLLYYYVNSTSNGSAVASTFALY